ncbi:acyltransferase [Acidisoma silvae]|uniref:Acyltransferase n=1 Tax=Acidisoma silvae TaxID=2802396 RepID=A0A963YPE0_9PROT|nr:acyltransferase [Acidisoma silvae]
MAAIFVAVLHGYLLLDPTRAILPNAHLAVDFFFCLSGFVIAHAYADKLDAGMPVANYLGRRIIRLAPLLIAGLVLGALVYIAGSVAKGGHQLSIALIISVLSIEMVPAGLLFGLQAYPTDNSVWSLFFELAANIAFAFGTVRRRVINAGTLAVFGLILALTAWHFRSIDDLGYQSPSAFLGGFARVAFPFLTGVMIWHWRLYKDRHAIWSWAAFLALPLLLVTPFGNWQTDLVAIVLVIPLIVITGTAAAGPRIAPALKLLGELSYPFYLIHQPVMRIFKNLHAARSLIQHHPGSAVAMALAVSAIGAMILSRLYDGPVRRWLTALMQDEPVAGSRLLTITSPAEAAAAAE